MRIQSSPRLKLLGSSPYAPIAPWQDLELQELIWDSMITSR